MGDRKNPLLKRSSRVTVEVLPSLRASKQETLVLDQLKSLEAAMRAHYELAKNEMASQMNLIDCLIDLSKKHAAGGSYEPEPCCDTVYTYFEYTGYNLMEDFMNKTRLLQFSNKRLMTSLDKLRKSKILFESYCDDLDMAGQSPRIVGTASRKSLKHFIECMADGFNYFHALALNLSYRPYLMQPSDLNSLEEYKEFLKPPVKFDDYLMTELTNCKCALLKPCEDINDL